MATMNMAYDHPAYLARHTLSGGQVNGAAGVSTKFCAWTNLLIKSATFRPTTAGTSADVVNLVNISGTTTTTTALGTIGSGATAFSNLPVPAANQIQLQGDIFYFQKGTDATGTYAGVTLEALVQPLANVTV